MHSSVFSYHPLFEGRLLKLRFDHDWTIILIQASLPCDLFFGEEGRTTPHDLNTSVNANACKLNPQDWAVAASPMRT